MKLLFASDIHGSATCCAALCDRIHEVRPDKIILLGDLLYHGPRNDLPDGYSPKEVIPLINRFKDRILAVRGNCDSEVDQMVLEFPCMADSATIMLEDGMPFFATHGHLWDPDNLPPLSTPFGFVYGHTHVKQAEIIGQAVYLNPGSISLPKDGSRSFAVYDNGRIELMTLDGDLIKALVLP